MIDAHVQAAVALLEAAGLRTTDGDGPASERPYVRVGGIPGRPAATSMTGRRDWRVVDLPLQLVGDSPRSVRWLADRVEAALLDVVLDVPGRTCAPADRIVASEPDVENDLTPPAWWSSTVYRVSSVPTTIEELQP